MSGWLTNEQFTAVSLGEEPEKTMSEKRIVLLLKQLNISLDQYGREMMRQGDTTPSQTFMLDHLMSGGPRKLYATNIHAELGISKAAISTLLKSLKKKGYLDMEADPGDDRRKRIILTEKACEAGKRVEKDLESQWTRLCEGFTRQELTMTENILERMLTNIRQEVQGGIEHDKNIDKTDWRI